jgi:hypothetical protein
MPWPDLRYLGFCALIVVAQVIPAVLLMTGMVKPGDDSFSEWKTFFDTFGVALLSESVTEKLIENVVPEFVEKNRYVTESVIKMIAAWLKEKNRNESDRFLETGVFKELKTCCQFDTINL